MLIVKYKNSNQLDLQTKVNLSVFINQFFHTYTPCFQQIINKEIKCFTF